MYQHNQCYELKQFNLTSDHANYPKILLVEDNKIIQKVTLAQINSTAYTSELASNGQQALAMHKANLYSLIILDIGLPDISGIDICKKIRRQGDTETPIIIYSSSTSNTKSDCLAAGASDYLHKPAPESTLRKVINMYLRKDGASNNS